MLLVSQQIALIKDRALQKHIFYILGQVSYTKYLRGGIRFIKEIPRSATGKIQRKELQKLIIHADSKF